MKKCVRWFASLGIALAVGAASAGAATTCNDKGCWSATVKQIKIDSDRRIYFLVDNSAALNNLIPADGCQFKSIWTGKAEPALFISTTDEDRDEKYSLLMVASATGMTIAFGPIGDASTPYASYCRVNSLTLVAP